MIFLYNLILIVLYPFFLISTLFNKKLKEFYLTRKEGKKRIQEFIQNYKNQKAIWLHASSVGELDQALAIFRILKSKHSNIPILITVFSLSVKNLDKIPSEGKAYLPIDFFWQWQFIQDNFVLFITFTWDVYPNLLRILKKKNCHNFLCSAAIEEDSYRVKWSFLFRSFYKNFDGIGVVDEYNYNNFIKLFNKNLKITGDSRYDSIVYKLENQKISEEDKKKLECAKDIIILASTYKECDKQLYPYLKNLIVKFPKRKIWIFPHHINEERLKETTEYLKRYNIKNVLFFSDKEFINKYNQYNIIIVDKLGILAYAYRFSKICYVGGAFHHRVHNTGEPAACGSIPFTGPNIFSSPVAILLWKNQLLFRFSNGKDLIQNMTSLLKNQEQLNFKSERIKELLWNQTGSSKKFYEEFLENLLKNYR
jgi:3-deoxy-D-manno-octulosonic-acid transferase